MAEHCGEFPRYRWIAIGTPPRLLTEGLLVRAQLGEFFIWWKLFPLFLFINSSIAEHCFELFLLTNFPEHIKYKCWMTFVLYDKNIMHLIKPKDKGLIYNESKHINY